MSSGRESVGDLIPPDMLQVFSEERQGSRGKRGNRRAGSIRRAFKWFKSQRRKNRRRATDMRGDLLATGSPVELPKSTLKTGPKTEVVGTISLQEFQENVFVDGERPKYVLDLHSEAQEGLKLLQQEDDRNGVDYPDDQSMISTVTAQTEDSAAFSELRGFESESTTADSVSMRSSISSRSTRSGLKRQASTFRPLKPDKTSEKYKSRKKHTRTIVGIPRHVQRELGLDRAAWITTNPLDDQLSNGDVIIPAIITAVDGASSSSEQESVQEHLQGRVNLHSVTGNNTELPSLVKPNNDILQRPVNLSVDPAVATLGVPGTENPTGTVMSISPQATYMSKIIPNAVLPPSVDVVELSRSRSRSSVRTVSKSSLVSASPASTRASSRASSYRSTTRSDYSGWSHSGSSETLVSDSSTISNSSTPRVASRGSQVENTDKPPKMNNRSRVAFKTTHVNGDSTEEDGCRKSGSAAAFTRNLSVIKRTKVPPAPPNRSYSLRNGKQTWKRSEDNSYLTGASTPDGSPYPAVISVSEIKGTPQNLSPKKALPSSNGPTTVPSKVIQPVSTNKKTVLVGAYTNGTSKLAELKNNLFSAKSLINGNSSPAVMAIWSLLEIPTHPKVLAPPAPPPETWAHNQRTFELLCGPGPVNYARWAKKRGLKIEDEPHMALANGNATSLLQSVKLKGKVQHLAPAASVAPSPSPPPEHCPPTPVMSQANPPPPPPDFVPSTPTLTAKAIRDLTSWIPPPPLFPPPAPPGLASATPVAVPNGHDFPPPPPPFSPQTLLKMPQLPPDAPPPPSPQIVTPPPTTLSEQKIQSPTQESQPSTQNELMTSSVTSQQINVPPPPPLPNDGRSEQVNVPPPPPLPTEVKIETSIETTDIEKRTSSPTPAKEETSGPVITQSLLQMVRLRSVKSNQSQAVDLDKPSQPKLKSSVNQEAPPKPVRRSLIMTSLPPEVEALSSTEPKTDSPSMTVHTNTTTVSNIQQGSTESETQSNNSVLNTQNIKLEPASSVAISLTTEPTNTSAPNEPVTKQPCAEPEVKPRTLKEQIQPSIPDPASLPSTTEPKDQSISEPKTQLQAQEPKKAPQNSEKKSSTVDMPSKMIIEQPKTQAPTPIVTTTTPVVSSPPLSNPSMRLQDAIRLKAAAMSSKDNQAKPFGLRSPPAAMAGGITVPNSPASTASFIFSKSSKKVVIETPTSVEVQADLKKTLVAEIASVSESAKSKDSHKMANKVPPPIAKKPNGKVESSVQNSAEAESAAKTEHVQTETVQTAGQEVQTEKAAKQ